MGECRLTMKEIAEEWQWDIDGGYWYGYPLGLGSSMRSITPQEILERAAALETDLARLQKQVEALERVLKAWYECPQDSVPDVLQDALIQAEALASQEEKNDE